MDTSIFLARLMGPVLVVVAIAAVIADRDMRAMAREFLDSRALIYMAGIIAMVAGLAVVNTHNVWVANWPVLITIFGWAMLVGGVLRIAQPAFLKTFGEKMIDNRTTMLAAGAVWGVIGLALSYFGYVAG